MDIEQRKHTLNSLRKQKYDICLKLAEYLLPIYSRFRSVKELKNNLAMAKNYGEGRIDRSLEVAFGKEFIRSRSLFYANISGKDCIKYKLDGQEMAITQGIYSAFIHIANGYFPAAYDLAGKISAYLAYYDNMSRKDHDLDKLDIEDFNEEQLSRLDKFQILDVEALTAAYEAEVKFKEDWKQDLDEFKEIFDRMISVRNDFSYLDFSFSK